jgi:hypothetical protein
LNCLIIQPADLEIANALLAENSICKARKTALRNYVNVLGRTYGSTTAHILSIDCISRAVWGLDPSDNPRLVGFRVASRQRCRCEQRDGHGMLEKPLHFSSLPVVGECANDTR